jgi:lactoylglutathione lyase
MNLLLNIDVPDLEKAEAFYTSAFGLTRSRRLGDEVLELTGGSVPIFLLLKAGGSSPFAAGGAVRSYARHWCPVHFDVVVPDIDVASARVLAAGAVQEQAVSVHAWGKLAMFADPFGHGFCLVQFLGRGYAEIT